MSELSVAVVGAGSMAREHIRAFQSLSGVRVTGIHSRTRARAEALATEFGIPQICDSLEELHARTAAELVVVTVFETAMHGVAVACCGHPWTLLLEKPPGIDLADAQAIQHAATVAGRRVYVGLNRRFLSSTQAAAADLATRQGPRFIHVQDQQSLETARALKHPPEVVERWMFANSIHLVDYLRLFGRGEIVRVVPMSSPHPERLDVVLARIDFGSGDVGLYEAVWCGPGPWGATVTTAGKRWELRPLEQAQFQNAGERRWTSIAQTNDDLQFKPGFRLQAEHVVAAVRGLPSDAVSLAEALETMQLIQAIYGPAEVATSTRNAA